MLIKITNIAISDITNNIEKQTALSNILRSHCSGYNIVWSNKDDLNFIIGSDFLGRVDIYTASAIKSNLREYGSIKNEVSHFIVVDFSLSNETFENHDENHEQKYLNCSYHHFLAVKKAQACLLLSECETDVRLYKIIGNFFSTTQSRCRIPLSFEITDGRGSGTKPIFSRLKEQRETCLCILDSDKKHPKGPMGETAKAFTQADLDFDGSALAFIIKQHEAESLLPNRVIEEAMRDESYAPEKFDALDRIIEVSAQDFDAKYYIDHKNGLNTQKAMSLDSKHGVFWNNIPLVNRHITHMNCQNPCPNCSAPCNIIDGLGENILLHSLSKLSVMTSQKINEVIEPQLKDLWCDLGKLLYSWGCSPVKSTSRS